MGMPTALSNAVILQGKFLTLREESKIKLVISKTTAAMIINGWNLSLENLSKDYDWVSSRFHLWSHLLYSPTSLYDPTVRNGVRWAMHSLITNTPKKKGDDFWPGGKGWMQFLMRLGAPRAEPVNVSGWSGRLWWFKNLPPSSLKALPSKCSQVPLSLRMVFSSSFPMTGT